MNIIAAVTLAIAAQDAGCVQPVRTVAQLDSAVVATGRRLEEEPAAQDLRCRIAALRMQAGRYEEADSILDQLLGEEPDHLDALLTQTILRRRQYRFADAERTLSRAAELAPESLEVRLLEGRHALDRMDLAADTIYRELLQTDPSSAPARLGLAEIAFWRDQHADAQELLDQALLLDPDLAPAHLLASRASTVRRKPPPRGRRPCADAVESRFAVLPTRMPLWPRSSAGDGALEDAYRHAQRRHRARPVLPKCTLVSGERRITLRLRLGAGGPWRVRWSLSANF